jgi:aerobic carbon-monoxide dehydrogenase medium subunit
MISPYPGLPEFDYIKPGSLSEASQFLALHSGEARPLMGGTDIFVRMRDRVWKDKYLVDVKGLDGMNQISFDLSHGLTIGAAVNMNRVINSPEVIEYYPLLADAASKVASYQLRTRATIVGNICNASPAGDTTGACILLGGVLNIHGKDGRRQEPLSNFFLGPGATVLRAGDIVTSIQFPLPGLGLRGTYIKLGRNKSSDLAIVGVTALGFPDEDLPSGFRIQLALASVAPVPLVVGQVEKILAEKPITLQALNEASQAAMEACNPIDDVRSSAKYRKIMVRNLSLNALREVWETLRH